MPRQSDTSFLTNFKQRPRQASILHLVQQRVGAPTDDDDLSLEGDTTTTTAPLSRLIDPAEDEALYDEPQPATSSSSRKRKRRTPPIMPSDPAELPLHHVSSDELSPEDSASVAARRSSPPIEDEQQSEPLPAPKPGKRPRRPGRMRGGLRTRAAVAVPASSSSPSVIEASSPHSTPPSSPVHTQAKPAPKGRKGTATTRDASKREKTKAVTTAALQALLPRRKPMKSTFRNDTFDIHSSSMAEEEHDVDVDSEEDELSRPQRRRAQAAPKARGKPGALKSPKATRSKAAKNATTKPAALKSTAVTARNSSRTYSRRSLADKENDDVEPDGAQDEEEETAVDANVPGQGKRVTSGELKEARDKFLQVDQWEMEFESADLTGASSPWR